MRTGTPPVPFPARTYATAPWSRHAWTGHPHGPALAPSGPAMDTDPQPAAARTPGLPCLAAGRSPARRVLGKPRGQVTGGSATLEEQLHFSNSSAQAVRNLPRSISGSLQSPSRVSPGAGLSAYPFLFISEPSEAPFLQKRKRRAKEMNLCHVGSGGHH